MPTKDANRMKIPPGNFIPVLADFGNTSSASIPLAMVTSSLRERMKTSPVRLLLAGCGVGFSLAAPVPVEYSALALSGETT